MHRAVAAAAAGVLLAVPGTAYGAAATTSIRANATHDGRVNGARVSADAKLRWSYRLPGLGIHPLVAGGRAYVLAVNEDDFRWRLVAVDVRSGRRLWQRRLPTSPADYAYDAGRIYVLDSSTLRVFDARAGRSVLRERVPPPPGIRPPIRPGAIVAHRGTIYFTAYTNDQRYYAFAVDGRTGRTRWTAPSPHAGGSPAVAGGWVVIQGSCASAQARAPASGELLWWHGADCGAGGGFPVLHGEHAYVSSYTSEYARHDVRTGEPVGTVRTSTPPVFAGSVAVVDPPGAWQAVDTRTDRVLWSRPRPSGTGDMLIAGGALVVSDGNRRLTAVELSSGRTIWRYRMPIGTVDKPNYLPWLGAGERNVVVTLGGWLFGYG